MKNYSNISRVLKTKEQNTNKLGFGTGSGNDLYFCFFLFLLYSDLCFMSL